MAFLSWLLWSCCNLFTCSWCLIWQCVSQLNIWWKLEFCFLPLINFIKPDSDFSKRREVDVKHIYWRVLLMELKIMKSELCSNFCILMRFVNKKDVSSVKFGLLKDIHINWTCLIIFIFQICLFTISYDIRVFDSLFIFILYNRWNFKRFFIISVRRQKLILIGKIKRSSFSADIWKHICVSSSGSNFY